MTSDAIEMRRQYQKKWRDKNREHIREYNKKWREKNRERLKQRKLAWNSANKDKVRAAQERYWTKKANARETAT